MQINARTHRSPSAHIKHTLRLTWRFLSPSPSLESVARQWKHWEAVSMAWPGLLFDWKTYAFYMLQLWFYQIAVKHTNHAPSFVPSLTVCTVPCGAVARCVCMFAHGGSIISQAGLRPRWRKNSQLGQKSKGETVPFTSQQQIGFECTSELARGPSALSNKHIQLQLWPPLGRLLDTKRAISGRSAARTVKSLIVTWTVCSNKRD